MEDEQHLDLRFWDRANHYRGWIEYDSYHDEKVTTRTRIYGVLAAHNHSLDGWFGLRHAPPHRQEGGVKQAILFLPMTTIPTTLALRGLMSARIHPGSILVGPRPSDSSFTTDVALRYIQALLTDDDSRDVLHDTVMNG